MLGLAEAARFGPVWLQLGELSLFVEVEGRSVSSQCQIRGSDYGEHTLKFVGSYLGQRFLQRSSARLAHLQPSYDIY